MYIFIMYFYINVTFNLKVINEIICQIVNMHL